MYRSGRYETSFDIHGFGWTFDNLDFKVGFDRLNFRVFRVVFDCLDFKSRIINGVRDEFYDSHIFRLIPL